MPGGVPAICGSSPTREVDLHARAVALVGAERGSATRRRARPRRPARAGFASGRRWRARFARGSSRRRRPGRRSARPPSISIASTSASVRISAPASAAASASSRVTSSHPAAHEPPRLSAERRRGVLVQQRVRGARRRRAGERVGDRVPAERGAGVLGAKAGLEVLAGRGREQLHRGEPVAERRPGGGARAPVASRGRASRRARGRLVEPGPEQAARPRASRRGTPAKAPPVGAGRSGRARAAVAAASSCEREHGAVAEDVQRRRRLAAPRARGGAARSRARSPGAGG